MPYHIPCFLNIPYHQHTISRTTFFHLGYQTVSSYHTTNIPYHIPGTVLFPSIVHQTVVPSYHIPTYDITSSTQEEHTLKVQGDEVISKGKMQDDAVINEEMKVQMESDGAREQQQPQRQQQPE